MSNNYNLNQYKMDIGESIQYTPEVLKSFKTCEVLKNHEQIINSIDFSPEGTKLLTSGNDCLITIFDIEKKEINRRLKNITHGCEKAIFTHNSKAILCAGKNDYRIMYWCLHSNEILFSFLGHSDVIIDLIINPQNDLFLSTSADRTSRLWDLHEKKCLAIFPDSQFATFDDMGKVITSVTSEVNKSTYTHDNYINLYNIDDIQKGPFNIFHLNTKDEMKQIKFTNNGAYIVCSTESAIIVLDAYNGKIVSNIESEEDQITRFDITPDSKYIAAGSESGNITVWELNGNEIASLEFHTNSCNCIKFCPSFALLASSCTNLVLWIPVVNEDNSK